MPHLTIEPNKTCNIQCANCYSIDTKVVKSLAQVKQEIDVGLEKRNLESISLVGGEPTLHPEVVEIVAYVKSKGLVCGLLTNGVSFLNDPDDSLLDRLVTAGVDRFVVHIDEGQQHVHRDIDSARRELCAKLEAKRVYFSLAITLSCDNEGCIPELMKTYAGYRYFDGILGTMARDPARVLASSPPPSNEPSLGRVYQSVSEDLEVEPVSYVPSSVDDDVVSWLVYLYYINIRTKKTFAISPRLNRWFRKMYRLLAGRHVFASTSSPTWSSPSFLLTAALELLLAPTCIRSLWALLRAGGISSLRFHYVMVQQGPVFDEESGQLHICYHCPDATIRNGKVTPVCVADQMSPLGGEGARVSREIVDQIYRHLNELPDPVTPSGK